MEHGALNCCAYAEGAEVEGVELMSIFGFSISVMAIDQRFVL